MQIKRIITVASMIVIACIVSYFSYFFAGEIMKNFSCYFLYPTLKVQADLVDSVKDLIYDRKDMKYIKKTIYQLHKECEGLRAENIKLLAVQNAIQEITEIAEFRKQYNMENARISRILCKHFSPQEHYFLIDGGSDQGLACDMVVVYNNCLVGKIEQVYARYSKVILVTDELCKVAAYCAKTQSNGIYQGCNNIKKASLLYVPHFKDMILHDTLLSSGQGTIFPAGFSLGSIESFSSDGLHYQITVKPHLDFESLTHCLVITR